MQNLTLSHIHYTQLDAMNWCATAQIQPQPLAPNSSCFSSIRLDDFQWQHSPSQNLLSASKKSASKRQRQRRGVRLLLHHLLSHLRINDTLDESQFPYRLVNSRYYVCFSHSGNNQFNDKVAVAISHRRAVGIDIELQEVAWHVVQRFYHTNEIAILADLAMTERTNVSKYLWQLKESFIKVHQYKLAQGLGMDYSALIADLMIPVTPSSSLKIIDNNETAYQIALLPVQQTVVVF